MLSFNVCARLHLRGGTQDADGNAVEYVVIGFPGEVAVDGEEMLLSFEFVRYFGEGYIQLPVYLGSGYCRKQAMAKPEAIPFINSGIAISTLPENNDKTIWKRTEALSHEKLYSFF